MASKSRKVFSYKKDHVFLYGGDGVEDPYESVKDNGDDFRRVIDKLTAKFTPHINKTLHIRKFKNVVQFDDEPFDIFVYRLRDKAKQCGFDNIENELQHQIIMGSKRNQVKERASHKPNLARVLGKT